jgi:hypothetical protein
MDCKWRLSRCLEDRWRREGALEALAPGFVDERLRAWHNQAQHDNAIHQKGNLLIDIQTTQILYY